MKRFFYVIAMLTVVLCLFAACQKECVHEYQSEITQAPSCTKAGVETFTCALCQDSYTQPIPFLSHAYDDGTVEKEASCSEEGLLKYTCVGCSGIRYEQIKKLPHTLGEASVTKEPNCSEEGERTGSCTICGAENVVEKIPVNDVHSFENTVIREATCTDPGEGLDTCTLCGHTQTCQYSYKAHTFGQPQTVTAATCTKDGKAKVTCSACDATEDRKISAAGHKWTGGTCTQASTCSVCGATGSKAKHDYEILSEHGDGQHFAKQVDKKCKTCNLEKTLYYAGKFEFDLETIYKELEDYAKRYGFNVTDSFSDVPHYQQIQKENSKVLDSYLEYVGKSGPEYLIKRGKAMIDQEYSYVKNSIHPMSKYTIHLKVSYGQSASMGLGSFGIQVTHTG